MNYSSWWYPIYHWCAVQLGKIHIGPKRQLGDEEREELAHLMAKGYYVILTGNRGHFTSWLIRLLVRIKTGKWCKYTHAFMNCDNLTDAKDVDSFRFVEALATGVRQSSFNDVFECTNVCVLTPASMSNENWTLVIDGLLSQHNKQYDDLFDLSDDSHVSCVELVLDALKCDPSFSTDYGNLVALIEQYDNLSPSMFRECKDFVPVYEKV